MVLRVEENVNSFFFKFFKVFWFYKTVQHSICVKQRKEITNIFNIYMGIHIVCVFIQIYIYAKFIYQT